MAEGTFDDITERLDQIIAQVRSKDTSLERSLDLFDEAIELGSRGESSNESTMSTAREADMLDADSAAGGTSAPAAEGPSEQPAGQTETHPDSSGA